MKRSQAVNLVMMGLGLTAVVLLWEGEEDSVAAAAYESVDQCAASGRYSRDACQQAFGEAKDAHQRSAPRYSRREDCEAEFGANACTALPPADAAAPGPTAASLFVPAMAGFLLANAVTSGYAAQPIYRPCTPDSSDPQCRRSGTTGGGGGARWFYTGTGARVSSAPGQVAVERAAFTGRASSVTLARGGFGARAAAHAAS